MPALHRYPDFIQRMLLHERTLEEPLPSEPTDYALVIRIREASEASILGDAKPLAQAPVTLLRAGLFYYHNALGDCHREVARTDSPLTSYWHGMLHRREGDFDNARYWMRRTGEHPTFQEMQGRASDASPHMAKQPNWDPYLFIHLCEQYKYGETSYRKEIGHLQKVEFSVLFDYVWRQCVPPASATG